jgi:hypothetical protein
MRLLRKPLKKLLPMRMPLQTQRLKLQAMLLPLLAMQLLPQATHLLLPAKRWLLLTQLHLLKHLPRHRSSNHC